MRFKGISEIPELFNLEDKATLINDYPKDGTKGCLGKLVVVMFWTASLPGVENQLAMLDETKRNYQTSVFPISVHSPKFGQKNQSPPSIVKSVLSWRNIAHTVIDDKNSTLSKQLKVSKLPTTLFIDPLGRIVGRFVGEIKKQNLLSLLSEMVGEYQKAGLIKNKKVIETKNKFEYKNELFAPNKVAADKDHLYITAKREGVLVTDHLGNLKDSIPTYTNPSGVAIYESNLLVTDTDENSLTMFDLKTKKKKPVIPVINEKNEILGTPSSVCVAKDVAYITNQGLNNLVSVNLATNKFETLAGTGEEGGLDGLNNEAQLAWPSGCDVYANSLYFTDAKTSSLRVCGIGKNGKVVTLIKGKNFGYGDKDGDVEFAKIHYPNAVKRVGSMLILADTYNDKIKLFDLQKFNLKTFINSKLPTDVLYLNEKLYVPSSYERKISVYNADNAKLENEFAIPSS